MSNWRIHVLGDEPTLFVDGRPFQLPEMAWALLACLLSSSQRSVNRSRIVTTLWPDSDEEAGRHCLATMLWRLKQRLPCISGLLETGGDKVALTVGPRVWIDALVLEQRAQRALGNPGWLNSAMNRHKLWRSLKLYRGEFVARFDNDMVLIERERLRAVFLDTSFQLAFAHAQHDEWRETLEITRSLCAVEPLREDAQRLLIQAYAACGNRALAIQQYQDLEKLLSAELAVRPMRETIDVIGRIASTPEMPSPSFSSSRNMLLQARAQMFAAVAIIDEALGQLQA